MIWDKSALDEDALSLIEAVWTSSDDSLSALLRAGGFDPTHALRGLDLRGWPLATEDLRGFDLSGADLRGSGIEDAILDDSTVLLGALLDEDALSQIAHAVPGLFRADWVKKPRTANTFGAEFADILDNEPVHSRHWVARVATAWKTLESLSPEEREPFISALAGRSSQWLLKFRGKADPGLSMRVLELTEAQPHCHPELVRTLIELVLEPDKSWELISSFEFEELIKRQSRGGLYGLELRFKDDERYRFFKQFNTLSWFNEQFGELARDGAFARLWRLAIVAFGDEDPPAGDIDIYRGLHRREIKQLGQNIKDALSGYFKEVAHVNDWPRQAHLLLASEDNLRYLRRVFDGTQRASTVAQEEVGGLPFGVLEDLERYAQRLTPVPGLNRGRTTRARLETASQRLSDRAASWLVSCGPINKVEAQDLLNASYGIRNELYWSKLARGRLELRGSFGPTLVLKDRERIREFRAVARRLVSELDDNT